MRFWHGYGVSVWHIAYRQDIFDDMNIGRDCSFLHSSIPLLLSSPTPPPRNRHRRIITKTGLRYRVRMVMRFSERGPQFSRTSALTTWELKKISAGFCWKLFIKPWLKNSGQTLIAIFTSNLDWNFFIAIMIVIEKLIRINQTLIVNFQATLIGKFWAGFDW